MQRIASPGRSLTRVVAVVVLAIAATMGSLMPDASAQQAGFNVATDKTYQVDIGARQITVIESHELRKSSASQSLNASAYTVVVPDSAIEFSATMGGSRLETSFERTGPSIFAKVQLPPELQVGDTATLSIRYVIPDSGPLPSPGNAHISSEVVSLHIWAAGSPNQATVRVILPAGFAIERSGNLDLFAITTDGDQQVLEAVDLAEPGAFRGQIVGLSAAAIEDNGVKLSTGTAVVLARPNNTAWREFVVRTLNEDLPVLEELIGIPWPLESIVIQESSTPEANGFSGFYNHRDGIIEMGDIRDRSVLIHELAHAWFNAELSPERWVTEGLAEELTSRVIESTGGPRPNPWQPDLRYDRRLPLSQWVRSGSIGPTLFDFEVYHYNASWWAFRQLHSEIGAEAFSGVLVAFDEQGEAGGDRSWRGLFEQFEDHAQAEFLDNLFGTYVLPPVLEDQLATRRQVLTRHQEVFDDVDLTIPAGLRRDMTEWRWDQADRFLDKVELVLPALRAFDARARKSSLDPTEQWRLFASAQRAGDLQDLAEDLTDDVTAIDKLDTNLALVKVEGNDQGVVVEFETMRSLGDTQTSMQETRWAIQDLAADRSSLLAAADQAGFGFTFEPDVPLAAAQQELTDFRTQLEDYLVQQAAVNGRIDQLRLTAPTTVPADDIPDAISLLDVQMATMGALAAAQDSIDDVGRLQQIGLFGRDLDADLLAARQAFEAGAFEDALTRSAAITQAANTANSSGKTRIFIVILATLGVLIAIVGSIAVRDARRTSN